MSIEVYIYDMMMRAYLWCRVPGMHAIKDGTDRTMSLQ